MTMKPANLFQTLMSAGIVSSALRVFSPPSRTFSICLRATMVTTRNESVLYDQRAAISSNTSMYSTKWPLKPEDPTKNPTPPHSCDSSKHSRRSANLPTYECHLKLQVTRAFPNAPATRGFPINPGTSTRTSPSSQSAHPATPKSSSPP